MKANLFLSILIIGSFATGNAYAYENKSVTTASTTQSKIKAAAITKKQWGINQVELERYNTLMKGVRGSVSVENISPLEVLGIHARTDKEREKYALAWARIMHEDAEKILKFQFAYDKASKLLVGDQQMIDMATVNTERKKSKPHPTGINGIKEGDRVLLFVRYENCSKCEYLVAEIKQKLTSVKKLQLDIYFVDTTKGKDDKKLREWSKRNRLDRSKLVTGTITLNHDKKLISKYFGLTAALPIAAVIRNGSLQRIK